MRTPSRFVCLLALSAAASAPVRADQLRLDVVSTIDVTALNLQSVGDVSVHGLFGRIWISDGSTHGRVFEVSAASGALLSSFDPATIPGLDQGPEALAIQNGLFNPSLAVLSSINENEGGRVSQAGALIDDYGTGVGAMGADFDMTGDLWIVTGTAPGAGSTMRRIDRNTGQVLQSIPIIGTSSRAVDITFDPLTNHPYVLFEETGIIGEVSLVNGILLDSTNIAPDVPHVGVGGIDFDSTGEFLYVAMGATQTESRTITVLRRRFDSLSCQSSNTACPCGNGGSSGSGCNNSFGTGGADLESTGGVASITIDTLRLRAFQLPPVTSCLLFQGTAIPTGGPQVFGDGLRCVAGTVIRLGITVSSGGVAEWPRAGDPGLGAAGAIPANGTRLYQVWYRNAANFCTASTFNLSNSIVVKWFP